MTGVVACDDASRDIGLNGDTGLVRFGCDDVVPIVAECSFEDDAIVCSDCIGGIVDLKVKPFAGHANTGVGVWLDGLGGGCISCGWLGE